MSDVKTSDVKTGDIRTSDEKTGVESSLAKLPRGEVSPFDLVDTHPEDDVVPDPRQAEVKKQLDKALKDSFPASDPVSALQPITAGPTEEGSEALAADAEENATDDAEAVEAKTEKQPGTLRARDG